MTPLGRPVVPEEYGSASGSSPSISTLGGCPDDDSRSSFPQGIASGILSGALSPVTITCLRSGRDLVEHLLEERKEFALNDDRAGLRVLQLVANLALFVGWIHRADYYANAGCRDKRNSVLGTIGHQQANPVALAQPETIQAIGNAIDHTYNLAVGQIDVVVNNRGAVWIAIGGHTQELIIRDIRKLDVRTKKLWRNHFFRHTSESFLLNGECFRM